MGLLKAKDAVQLKPQENTPPADTYETRALSPAELEQLKALQGRASGALNSDATENVSTKAEWKHTENFEQEASIDSHTSTTALAVQDEQETRVRTTAPTGIGAPNLEDAGFGGLALGSRSFPIISLKTEGAFEDTEGNEYGKEVKVRVINSRPKTAVQASMMERGKPIEEVFFTYDGVLTSSGKSVAELIEDYTERGFTIAKREYTDVLATIDDPTSEFDGEIRILSVSPTSRERLAGKMYALCIQNNWTTEDLTNNIGEYTLTASVGAKVQKAVQPFYPWNFSFKKA